MTTRLQNFASIAMMAVMMGGALAALVAPVSRAHAVTAPIDNKALGLEYPEATGLGHKDVRETASTIIKAAMGLLGIVAVVIILIGGFTWMTAGGNTEKVDEAKDAVSDKIASLGVQMEDLGKKIQTLPPNPPKKRFFKRASQ